MFKFDIGNIVYFLRNNLIFSDIINARTYKYYDSSSDSEEETYYTLRNTGISLEEKELFKTKEELIDNLLKESE